MINAVKGSSIPNDPAIISRDMDVKKTINRYISNISYLSFGITARGKPV